MNAVTVDHEIVVRSRPALHLRVAGVATTVYWAQCSCGYIGAWSEEWGRASMDAIRHKEETA